ncbi:MULTISPECIES: PAS domain-containing sensor histidine kinase [Pelosinus]|uniref:histidine kinase n=1 Tax=Pelosinus fermentans B4 TaxID=1149862 RepID=I9AZQ1_9FIRM|nr:MULTISPECIES: PAS domain-containing sensor histidine kinase [Pelosinus]EIW18347.1 PAS sensor protein [Pelosinus fermentans B4]EIW24329.1 multi-sensor signal transduction histidine kinase [Pelosinus fermentans A11]OAM94332.1 multi-sensor signal transduction histidine kinase [Pelosinus fermentans DSM 17108]SDR06388.1 PAS domain S-box-containing protein [Pelosinus fermentans]
MFRINTLKKKLVIGVFIAFICPYMISSVSIVEFIKDDVKNNFIKLSDQQIDNVDSTISNDIINPAYYAIDVLCREDSTKRLMETIDNHVIVSPTELDISHYQSLVSYYKTQQYMDAIGIASENGGYFIYPGASDDFSQYDPRRREWYQAAINKHRQPNLNGPYHRLSGLLILSVSQAVLDHEGNIIGVMFLGWDLQNFQHQIEQYKLGKTGFMMVLDQNNKFIVSPKNHSWLSKQPIDLGLFDLEQLESKTDGMHEVMLNGTKKYIRIKITDTGWKIISVIDADELSEQIFNVIKKIIGIFVITLLIVVLAIGMLAKSFTTSIESLSEVATSITQGNRIVHFNIKRNDEIGTLANSIKQMVKELFKQEREFKTLIENTQDGISRIDKNLRYVYVNPAMQNLFGVPVKSFMGKTMNDILPDQNWIQAITVSEQQVFNTGLEVIVLQEYRRFNGDTSYIHVHVIPEFDQSNQVETILCVFRDVTQLKDMEKAVARANSLNLVGEMAAGIAHEVRNPMAAVRGYLQFLSLKDVGVKYSEQFKTMIEEIDNANAIIKEFLALAKDCTIDLNRIDLNSIIEAVFPLLLADARMIDKDIVTNLQPLPMLLLDEKQIRQLLFNLVRNGQDAMMMKSHGVVTISTSVRNQEVVLAIKDEGAGISQHVIDKIGIPFITTKDTGTGLGLAICYSIAQRHNARIEFVTSTHGTIFYVSFTIV